MGLTEGQRIQVLLGLGIPLVSGVGVLGFSVSHNPNGFGCWVLSLCSSEHVPSASSFSGNRRRGKWLTGCSASDKVRICPGLDGAELVQLIRQYPGGNAVYAVDHQDPFTSFSLLCHPNAIFSGTRGCHSSLGQNSSASCRKINCLLSTSCSHLFSCEPHNPI